MYEYSVDVLDILSVFGYSDADKNSKNLQKSSNVLNLYISEADVRLGTFLETLNLFLSVSLFIWLLVIVNIKLPLSNAIVSTFNW